MIKVGDKVVTIHGEEGTVVEVTCSVKNSDQILYKIAIPRIYHTFVFPQEIKVIEG